MYNTKLNEIYTDAVVQEILAALAYACEKVNVKCLVYGHLAFKAKQGGTLTFPSLLMVDNISAFEPCYYAYDDALYNYIIDDSDLIVTSYGNMNWDENLKVREESEPLWVM